MRPSRLFGKNHLVLLLVLLLITTVLVVSAFSVSAMFPDSLGRKPYSYTVESVDEFSFWVFEIDNLRASFPRGGLIVILNETDYKRSLLLLGDGIFLKDGESFSDEQEGGIFMVMEHSLFDEIRGDTLFRPVSNRAILEEVEAVVEIQKGVPAIWQDYIPLSFHPGEGLVYYYLLTQEGSPILPPERVDMERSLQGSYLLYVLLFIIAIPVMLIFSLDHNYSPYFLELGQKKPAPGTLLMVPLAIAAPMIAPILGKVNQWPEQFNLYLTLPVILIIFLLGKTGFVDQYDLGLRLQRLRHGYILAIVVASLLIVAIRGIPSDYSYNGNETLNGFLFFFFLIALPREMLLRGYVQTALCRIVGVFTGVLLTATICGVGQYYYLLWTRPWILQYPYISLEIAVLAPGLAAVLGVLYLRTENAPAGALLYSLLMYLPDGVIQ